MANEDFKFSHDYISMFNEAKRKGNIDRMEEIWNAALSEFGVDNPVADMNSASAGKRRAEALNAQQNGTSFEGSVPGKKI
jgi:hypothetical protein